MEKAKMENLWPDDIGKGREQISAIRILKEQAVMLGELTGNILMGEVRARSIDEDSGEMDFDFYVVAPLLQNYRYRLLQVALNIESVYPIKIYVNDKIFKEIRGSQADPGKRTPITATDEYSFKGCVKQIFNTSITRNIISNLKDQAMV